MQHKKTSMTQAEWTPEQVSRILSNPFYAIRIDPSHCEEHDFIMTEEDFIKAGAKLIEQKGAESYLRSLLQNLKGHRT